MKKTAYITGIKRHTTMYPNFGQLFMETILPLFLQNARDALREKERSLLPTINEKGDEILVIDNNANNVSRVNDRYSDLKDCTGETIRKLDDMIGQVEKKLETTKTFVNGKDELKAELGVIRDKVESLGPAAKDSEKIKEYLKELEVSAIV